VNVVIYAAISVYAGSWRSVQVETAEGKEIMTHKEAAKFPIVSVRERSSTSTSRAAATKLCYST
jgi:hypothetical protein